MSVHLSRNNATLQVSPVEDNPFAMVGPGEEMSIDIHIPTAHPEGVFWYHPHAHGAAAVQVHTTAVLRVEGRRNSILPLSSRYAA